MQSRVDRRSFVQLASAAVAFPMINRSRFPVFPWSAAEYSARCIGLMQRATVIDMLGLLTLDFPLSSRWARNPKLFTAQDFERFKASGINVFHTAVGVGGPNVYESALKFVMAQNALIAGRDQYFMRIDSPSDLDRVKASGKIGIVIGVQNSDHFRTLNDVDEFYGFGQRVSQLTYNSRNLIGNGATERRDDGISDFGVAIVERMNKVGMAVDVSHCGDKTSLDAFDVSKSPVLITHSNVRALNPGHPRCKPDEVIKKVGAAGSVMGITSVRHFVKGSEPTTLDDMINHYEYVARMIGIEHVGIGSDMDLDGYDDMPREEYNRLKASYKSTCAVRDKTDIEGVDHPKRMFDVTEALIKRGYGDDQIEGVLGGNFQRVLKQIWRVG